jgi:uncharacterized protein YceH (UPF0502 family)
MIDRRRVDASDRVMRSWHLASDDLADARRMVGEIDRAMAVADDKATARLVRDRAELEARIEDLEVRVEYLRKVLGASW